jgi:hypothetical protein
LPLLLGCDLESKAGGAEDPHQAAQLRITALRQGAGKAGSDATGPAWKSLDVLDLTIADLARPLAYQQVRFHFLAQGWVWLHV